MDGLQTYNRIQYSPEQLKNFIQGPADVEWKYAFTLPNYWRPARIVLGDWQVLTERAPRQIRDAQVMPGDPTRALPRLVRCVEGAGNAKVTRHHPCVREHDRRH